MCLSIITNFIRSEKKKEVVDKRLAFKTTRLLVLDGGGSSSPDTADSIISVTRCCCRLHVLFLAGILCMTIQEAVCAMFNRSSFLPVSTSPSQFPLLRSGPF
ncbi:hypothetical protein DPMN_040916 [Dreissena polymorpha]|uniref:Uncharacterized protein n=1 Tax=Dreissena polymorpha TaxID=45954 RepID=A0A9D4CW91_DREPO|nr:hypothetical protein DPMN_040916 [Dreissena polymorpha]